MIEVVAHAAQAGNAVADWKDWGTFAAAVVAAMTGIISVWRQRKGDRIRVGYGSLVTTQTPADELFVVNCSDHPVTIADYGAVLVTGAIVSYTYISEITFPREDFSGFLMECRVIEPHATGSAGAEIEGEVVGVYAYTATQWRPKIAFRGDVNTWSRLRIRFLVWARAWKYS